MLNKPGFYTKKLVENLQIFYNFIFPISLNSTQTASDKIPPAELLLRRISLVPDRFAAPVQLFYIIIVIRRDDSHIDHIYNHQLRRP